MWYRLPIVLNNSNIFSFFWRDINTVHTLTSSKRNRKHSFYVYVREYHINFKKAKLFLFFIRGYYIFEDNYNYNLYIQSQWLWRYTNSDWFAISGYWTMSTAKEVYNFCQIWMALSDKTYDWQQFLRLKSYKFRTK